MWRRYGMGVLLAVIGAVGIGVLVGWAPNEPAYAGKSLNQWLDGGYEDAAVALREIGPDGVPCILAKLRREHPRWGRRQNYRKLCEKMPGVLQRHLPRPKSAAFDEYRACNALVDLGPQAIPAVSAGLQDDNPAVKIACAWALGVFHQRGANVKAAVPALTRALQDSRPEVRERAAWAIARLESGGVTE
jgi:HEAT repeat protein